MSKSRDDLPRNRSSASISQQEETDREPALPNSSQPIADPRPSEKASTPSFPDGLEVLHDNPNAVVDICFVHGLTGNRISTWTVPEQTAPWPKTFLPDKIKRARILTYGYDAYNLSRSVAGSNRLIDHAMNLVADLTYDRASCHASSRPLIFVAHSLGGLVCKQAILLSRNDPERRRRDIFIHLKGIIFMGTPHKGSWMADWAKIPASALGMVKSTNKSLLRILETDDRLLESIQVRFSALVREQREAGRHLEIRSFFEELPLPAVGKVVSAESAAYESYDLINIHANHRDMVKFLSTEENGFKRLVGELVLLENEVNEEHENREDISTSVGTYRNVSIAPSTTKSRFNSGYASMLSPPSKSSMSSPPSKGNEHMEDDDKMSIRSIYTNAEPVELPSVEKEYLVSAFAGDLRQDLGSHGDSSVGDRLSACLPRLLKLYSLRLEESATLKTQRDAKEFIRQQRDRITHQFSESQMPVGLPEDENPPAPSNDGMSVAEKMAFWRTTEGNVPTLEPPPINQQPPEQVQLPPRYQDVRSFLLGGPAYQWLLENARSSALLSKRKGTVLEAIADKMDMTLSSMEPPGSRQRQVFHANFCMDWDLPEFLKSQEYNTDPAIAVRSAITVTGSGSNAQALSCVDYMRQTWPSSGPEVVSVLQKALKSPKLSWAGGLANRTELTVSLGAPKTLIAARGSQAALTELCEQLAWLGAALRTSQIPLGPCLATPTITRSEGSRPGSDVPSVTIQLEFPSSPIDYSPSTRKDATCWHGMFRNPTIVDGFPILARSENEQGLEVPLDMMTALGAVQFATHYGTTLVLKGFCTMLIPTKRTDQSIIWHFLFNDDGERIPYYSFQERCPTWVATDMVYTRLLEGGSVRNFVGWVSHITRHAGTKEMEYNKIDWTGAKACTAGLAIEQKLTITVSKIVGGSVSCVRGNRDKPEFIDQSVYKVQIDRARKMPIALYDTEAQRGWLVDGASALLHLVRAQMAREPYGGEDCLFDNLKFNHSAFEHPRINDGPDAAANSLKADHNKKHIILREFSSYEDEKDPVSQGGDTPKDTGEAEDGQPKKNAPAASGKRKAIYKSTCFKDLVSEVWSTLEQIYDRQIEVATTHNTKMLTVPFQNDLQGYEFMDIVACEHILTRRHIPVQGNGAAWLALVKGIHAITLFAQNFGDVYKPAGSGGPICQNWSIVPRGHEYLAAPVSLLKEIKQYSWKKGKVNEHGPEIAKGIFFSPSEDAFRTCKPACKHAFDRVQQLRDSSIVWSKLGFGNKQPRSADNFAEINGAILFGEDSVLDVEKLGRLSSPLTSRGGSFHDSGIGESVQASSQTRSSTTSPIKIVQSPRPQQFPVDDVERPPPSLDQTDGGNTTEDRVEARETEERAKEPAVIARPSVDARQGQVPGRDSDLPIERRADEALPPRVAAANTHATDGRAPDQTQGRKRWRLNAGLKKLIKKFKKKNKG